MTEFEPRHELIALRGLAGLTQQQLAERIEGSAEAVSNWERGRTVPRPKFRQPLADALGISLPNLEGLFGITLAINPTGHAVQPWLTHYESLIQAAGNINKVELRVVPLLLQTEPYATAVEQSLPGTTPEQVSRRVQARLERQQVLHRISSPLKLVTVLNETVLHKQTGGSEVMRLQLDHLIEIVEARPNVDIRVLAADGRDACVASSFELLARPNESVPFLAITFDESGVTYHEGFKIGPFSDKWTHLSSIIMSADESLAYIRDARDRLG